MPADDIRIKQSFRSSRKRTLLRLLVGKTGFDTTGGLIDLWLEVGANPVLRRTGNLPGWIDRDIAIASHWPAAPDLWVNALVEAGFLDVEETPKGRAYSIHGWCEHQAFLAGYDEYIEDARESGRRGGRESGKARARGGAAEVSIADAEDPISGVSHAKGLSKGRREKTLFDQEIEGSAEGTLRTKRSTVPNLTRPNQSVQKDVPPYPPAFESFWKAYPRKDGKHAAFVRWDKLLREGASVLHLEAAARNYAGHMKQVARDPEHIKHGATFLSAKDRHWAEYVADRAEDEAQSTAPLGPEQIVARARAGREEA